MSSSSTTSRPTRSPPSGRATTTSSTSSSDPRGADGVQPAEDVRRVHRRLGGGRRDGRLRAHAGGRGRDRARGGGAPGEHQGLRGGHRSGKGRVGEEGCYWGVAYSLKKKK